MCALFWDGDPRVMRRTQSSLAVSGVSGRSWTILNCSPDIREQIAATSALQPAGSQRGSPIEAVLLTSGDIDAIGGLLSLREQCRFDLHASQGVLRALNENPMFKVLDSSCVRRHAVGEKTRMKLPEGLTADAFSVPGKRPLYMEQGEPEASALSEFTMGFRISDGSGKSIAYVPSCAGVDEALLAAIDGVDILFFDGTLWLDDELITAGAGRKTGRRMGHLPIAGSGGSMAALQGVRCQQKLYIHINNTNPIICDGSPERKAVEAAGWKVPPEGYEIEL
jgi:pyrroloquinoline quinone biosynthesis protein B